MPDGTPDIVVDEDLARRLIATQFPALAVSSLEPFGEGFDNTLWLVNGATLFRFPRREVAVAGVEREIALLPHLAPLLPLPIPVPSQVGRPEPGDGFPWPFFGAPALPGREPGAVAIDEAARPAIARALGGFLKVLHSPSVLASVPGASDLPVDPFGRSDMGQRVRRTRSALGDCQRVGLWTPPAGVVDFLEEARFLPGPDPAATCLVQGDLHFRHLVIGDSGVLTGIIDWGDICRGAPAMDLQLGLSFFGLSARDAFFSAYGPVSDVEMVRARVLAFSLNALLALYGYQTGNKAVADEAVASLRRAAIE